MWVIDQLYFRSFIFAQEEDVPALEEEPTLHVKVPKVHLIGTGIEDCGPDRIRNQEGVCVEAVERD